MKTLKEILNEGSPLKKIKDFLLRMDLKADGRTPPEIQKQISNLSDEVLLKWAEDPLSVPGSVKEFQQKLITREIKKRKL